MQIILSEEECVDIHEALITEINEQKESNENRKRRGIEIPHGEKRLQDLERLKKRFEPYDTK